MRQTPLSGADRFILFMTAIVIAAGLSLELWWVVFHDSVQRGDWISLFYRWYGQFDAAYYFDRLAPATPLNRRVFGYMLTMESFNVAVQALNFWYVFAILKRRYYRPILELAIALLTGYAVSVYFLAAYFSGFSEMARHDLRSFVLFFGLSGPYLVFYGWLAWRAVGQLSLRLRTPA